MRLAVFASGSGTDFQALVQASRDHDLGWEVALLITNNAEAGAIDRAKLFRVPFRCINRQDFTDRDAFLVELQKALAELHIDFIALAGYLRKIPPEIVRQYRHRIINIHPALLPMFGGKGYFGRKVHEAVLAAGCKVTGVTVHLVDEEYDQGGIVAQRCVPVYDADDAESLSKRVLEVEHQFYPEVVTWFAQGKVKVVSGKVMVDKTREQT